MGEAKQLPVNAIVSFALMNDILAYLGTKPYNEVYSYIAAIHKNVRPIEEVVQSDEKEVQGEV